MIFQFKIKIALFTRSFKVGLILSHSDLRARYCSLAGKLSFLLGLFLSLAHKSIAVQLRQSLTLKMAVRLFGLFL